MRHILPCFRLFIILVFLIVRIDARAQQGPVTIPSPETAGFMKSGNIPVSTYTGAANISVPLFTIQDGPITLPISLSYNTSGIGVQEEATWVGLGFNLNTGGQITRAVRGADDFVYSPPNINYLSPDSWENKPLFSVGDGSITQSYWTGTLVSGTGDSPSPVYLPTTTGQINFDSLGYNPELTDWSSDMFSFSAGSSSGRFVLDDYTNPLTLVKSNVKIIRYNTNNFQITDGDGLIYTFDLRDESASMTLISPTVTTTWYLTQIRSADSNHIITFKYAEGNSMETHPVTNYSATISSNGQITTSTFTNYNQVSYSYLTEIDFDEGKVLFQSSKNRTDVSGVMQLDSAILYDYNGQEVQKYAFKYSYFQATTGSGPLDNNRLKLDSVVENDDPGISYTFGYDMDNIPSKIDGTDHWGYYNKAGGGIPTGIYEFIPTPVYGQPGLPSSYRIFPGGDFEAHWPYTEAMILNQVTYPTGGYSKFTYESNEFGNVPGYWQDTIISIAPPGPVFIYPVTDIDKGSVPITDTLNAGAYNLYCHFFCGDQPDLNGFLIQFLTTDGTLVWQGTLSQFSIEGGSGQDYYLTVNNIPLTGNLVCNVTSSRYNSGRVTDSAFFQFFELNLTAASNTNTTELVSRNLTRVSGGGLRLHSVINSDGMKDTSYKLYQYNYADGSTSGVIMNYPAYIYFPYYQPSIINSYLYFSSSSRVGLSTSASGSYIGYSHVTEIDGDSVNNIGSTEYDYYNVPDAQPFTYGLNLPSVRSVENGLLVESVQYDSNHDTVSKLVNTYSAFDPAWKSATGVQLDPVQNDGFAGGGAPSNGYPYDGEIPPAYFWKDFQLDYKLLSQARSLFNSTDHSTSVQATTQYLYATNHNPQKIIQSTSTSEQDQTEYRYPDDFTSSPAPAFVQEMATYNLLDKPIEVIKSKVNGAAVQAIGGQLNVYGTGATRGMVTQQYDLYTATPITWTSANFSNALSNSTFSYNSNYVLNGSWNYLTGNVTDYANLQGKTSYKWGYNSHYPIAQCVNATSSEFYSENFEDNTSSGVVTGAAHTGNKYLSGAYTVTWTRPDSRHYVISYWYKSGSAWQFSAPQSYAGSSFTLSGGTAYDDINIYPSDALMTTYTYAPLIGMSAQIDPSGKTMYYGYDALGRLAVVKDNDGNVIKTYNYHYHNQKQ
jgi:YD repeat-containing protein